MKAFISISVALTGVYLVVIALMMHTENSEGAFILKVIPFFLGVACIVSALALFGIIPGG